VTVKGISGIAAAGLVALLAVAAAKAQMIEQSQSALARVTLRSPGVPPEGKIRFSVIQVDFPGLPPKTGCRMQIRAYNEGKVPATFRVLVDIRYYEKVPVGTWLVPYTDLQPGQEVLRLYSCKPARYVRILTDSPYAWPTTCSVAGKVRSPCPLVMDVQSSLALPGMKALQVFEPGVVLPGPKKKKGKKKKEGG
jgi:hypothetical protein